MLPLIFSCLFMFSSFSSMTGEILHYLNSGEEATLINETFRVMQVNGENGKYVVTGESRTKNGHFYYVVEDGHNELVSEKQVHTKAVFPSWSTFRLEVNIPERDLPENGAVILYLFERNKEGQIINGLPVKLETIQQS
ncbi:intracellular proteinase inhibitor [Cytobacillus depressus]|uniref:Intracellular proteinase inhibitor n=1 Tax=Cytobacillus depressus TaxID=1602942 RepID=A0A6L3V6W1_9BACI|nr:Gmad2 immunoglobulin-like domain-containing protein [Cytobacillus depressus]KAB2337182.1 intracellular proteinase inhibitor [Cytobacillus depressus]